MAHARLLTRNQADAADATQEAFVDAFRNLSAFDPAREFYAWFYVLLPFPATYHPYSLDHVVGQVQLLFLSALAFTLLMRTGISPPELRSISVAGHSEPATSGSSTPSISSRPIRVPP